MIEHIKDGLNDKELKVLIYSLAKLGDYFQNVYNEESEENQYESWSDIIEDNK